MLVGGSPGCKQARSNVSWLLEDSVAHPNQIPLGKDPGPGVHPEPSMPSLPDSGLIAAVPYLTVLNSRYGIVVVDVVVVVVTT